MTVETDLRSVGDVLMSGKHAPARILDSDKQHSTLDTITDAAQDTQQTLESVESESTHVGSQRMSVETTHTAAEQDVAAQQPPPDLEAMRTVSSRAPLYSIFTLPQKRFIVAMAAIGGFFSAVSANIYFPALNALEADFKVSAALMNLTLTTYMIFQGAAPLLIGDLADVAGRRPAYLICFTIYIAANIGLALCPNYGALLALRCLQSTGSSATIALGSGVVADIADASERGIWMGYNTAGPNIAPAIGPVIGGLLAQYLGWRWIFWFLLILSSTYMIPLAILFPETSRKVVGNGSIPAKGWNMSLLNYLQIRKTRRLEAQIGSINSSLEDTKAQDEVVGRKIKLPNPLHGLKLFGEKNIGLVLLFNGVLFIPWYMTLSTIPYLFARNYGLNELQVGLCFLPLGVGALLAPIINGKMLDWNFRRTAAKLGMVIDRKRATNLREFPLEKARLQVSIPLVWAAIISQIIFGWVLQYKTPLPIPLIVLFVQGVSNTGAFGGLNVLLVDLVPESPSVAVAANNFSRCWLGAGTTAVNILAINAMGAGGAFTLSAGLLMLCTPISVVLQKKGPQWREERRKRLEALAEAKALRHKRHSDPEVGLEKGK